MSRQATIDARPVEPTITPTAPRQEEALPLPKWLTRVYYIFPIILYVPDMIFNFYVYSNGVSSFNPSDITTYPQTALWASLAAGIVGMAWLLSVLAPWHWARGNKFQSMMCWIGVVIATAITTWCSLAFRVSKENHPFPTDLWFQQVFHINITNFSPTTILVAISPPFWGLFWAIVQPAERRRNAAEQAEEFEVKKIRVQQEAELKKMRAEANAQVRGAQFAGLAASMKAARTQIGAAMTNAEEVDGDQVIVTPENTTSSRLADRVIASPTGSIRRLSERRGSEESDSGEHEILRGAAANMSYSVAAPSRDDVFEAPEGDDLRPRQGMLLDGRGPSTQENETLLSTSRPGMPRASTLLRNYADGEHVMRTVDADVERMRARGMKITIKTFAEHRGIELGLSKQLLAKWREWKQHQQPDQRYPEAIES